LENLISKEYQQMITDLHNKRPWGGAASGNAHTLNKYMILSQAKSLLDYGAGRSALRIEMEATFPDKKYVINEYEPGIPKLAGDPPVSDAVVSFDVMEHVETDKVDNVIQHIYDKCNLWTYHKICLRAATGSFPGTTQNLHLTIKPGLWWLEKFSNKFNFIEEGMNQGYVWFLGVKK
jgi:hypothetical protein